MGNLGRPKIPFWDNVEKTDYCWNWLRSKNRKGYGYTGHNGKIRKAHRVAWEITNGAIPENIYVLHKCDNPSCCNPEHLFLGTLQDNVKDCVNKGRRADFNGTKSPRAIFTTLQVNMIRKLAKEGNNFRQLAKQFLVDPSTIGRIVNRITYRKE